MLFSGLICFLLVLNIVTDKIAHELARLAKFPVTRDWFEDPLDEIVSLLIDDVNVIYN